MLWPGPSCWFFLPRSVSPGRKGDSQALMEGGCLPWLFSFGEAHCLSPLLMVTGWPDVARGSPVGSRGSWPSPIAFCPQTSGWAARDGPPSPVGRGEPRTPCLCAILPVLGPKGCTSLPRFSEFFDCPSCFSQC